MRRSRGMGKIRKELAQQLRSQPSTRETLGIEGQQPSPHAMMGTKYVAPAEEQRRKMLKVLNQ